MRKQALLALLFLFNTFYAASSSINMDLRFEDETRFYIRTDASFVETSIISTTGEVIRGSSSNLNNGDAICPGTIRVTQSNQGSSWLRNPASFAAFSIFPRLQAEPTQSAAVVSNRPIRWVSQSDFQTLQSVQPPDRTREEPLLPPSAFENEPVTYEKRAPDTFPNKLGGVQIFCKGRVYYEVEDSTGRVISTSSFDVTSPVDQSSTLTTAGAYSVSMSLRDVDCIGGIHKLPDIPNDPRVYRTYLYRANRPSVPAPTETKTINVELRQISAQVVSTEPDTLSMEPEETQLMSSRIRNTGTSPIRITGVGATDGFIAEPQGDHCGGGFCISDGFDSAINPGQERDVWFFLTAPAGMPATSTPRLIFNYEPVTSSSCTRKASNPTTQITVNRVEPEAEQLSCIIDPEIQTAPAGSDAFLAVACTENGRAITCPSDTAWSITALNNAFGIFTESDNAHAVLSITNGEGNIMLQAALGNSGVNCNSTVIVSSSETSCSITGPASVPQGRSGRYGIRCFRSGINEPCPQTLQWFPPGVPEMIFTEEDNTHATIQMLSDSGTGNLMALLDPATGGPSCSIPVTATSATAESSQSCSISPASLSILQNESADFVLSCADRGAVASCNSVAWTVRGLSGTALESDGGHLLFNFTSSSGSGSVNATATVAGNSISCESAVSMGGSGNGGGEELCIPGTPGCVEEGRRRINQGCRLSPSTLQLHPEDSATMKVTCDSGTCSSGTFTWSGTAVGSLEQRGETAIVTASHQIGTESEILFQGGNVKCNAFVTTNPLFCKDFY